MKGHLTIGKAIGVPLALHYSWVVVAALIAISLAVRFRAEHADWSLTVVWVTAIVTGVLFFAGLILHELAHAVAAKVSGVTTLWRHGSIRMEQS